MAESFKNIYNEQFFDQFTKDLQLVIHDFDACEFLRVGKFPYRLLGKGAIEKISSLLQKELPGLRGF